jgi:predicted nucleotidyltransferase
MVTTRVEADWQFVEEVVAGLRRRNDVLGVIVFGSLARHERTSDSDVDLIVVVAEASDRTSIRGVIAAISADTGLAHQITPIFFTPAELVRELEQRPSFATHLADEGLIVHRTPDLEQVESALDPTNPVDEEALRAELRSRMKLLSQARHLDRFNGEFTPLLAQLYALGRSAVILKLLECGVRQYSWTTIFDTYAALRPDLGRDLERVRKLRKYYDHIHDRRELPVAEQQVGQDFVAEMISSISSIADS